MNGWLKLHRALLDKPIWQDATPEQSRILITLLMMANYEEKEWEWGGEVYSLKPGQFVTSLPSLVHRCGKGITESKVRTALKRFATLGLLTDESTNKNRIITIVNWGFYQETDMRITDSFTNKQRTKNGQITSSKKVRNKNKRNEFRLNEFSLDLTKGEAI